MQLYFILTLFHVLLGGTWLFLSLKFKKDLMLLQVVSFVLRVLSFLQHGIAFVIAAGFLENFVFGLDYLVYNFTGKIYILSFHHIVFFLFFS